MKAWLPPLRAALAQRRPPVAPDASSGVLEDLQRTETIIVVARWFGVALGLLQVTIYSGTPYPPGLQAVAYGLVGALAVGNVTLWTANRRVASVPAARHLGVVALAFDVTIAMAFVTLYTFDPSSSLFTVLFIVTAAGALRFQLAGALLSWALVTVLYVARELYGRWAYDIPLMIDSITFRMGILLVVTLIMGMMAQKLWREQQRLAAALRELQRIDSWRSGLVNVLAHDVRSPLGNALGSLELLCRRGDQLGQQRAEQLMDIARRQTQRTLRLADDLLDLARLEQDRLRLRPDRVTVREVIESAIDIVPDRDQIAIDVDEALEAVVDRARLEQIVVNLVGNALKHGRPPVRVSAVTDEQMLTLTVQDQGHGVPVEDRSNLFAAFAQGPRSDSVGLGLWIVAQLAHVHGGRAFYDEASADGTTFVVHLRELPTEPGATQPESSPLRATSVTTPE